MKYCILTILSFILALNAQYTTSKYDTLFIKASASFHNHQKYVEPARKEIIAIGEDIIPFLAEKEFIAAAEGVSCAERSFFEDRSEAVVKISDGCYQAGRQRKFRCGRRISRAVEI
jgi:hypothetical protein